MLHRHVNAMDFEKKEQILKIFLSFSAHKTSRQVQNGSPADLCPSTPPFASSFSTSTIPVRLLQSSFTLLASFVPDDSRRLSRLTGFRGWKLVLTLQPCSSGSNRKLSMTPLGAPELSINLQNCSVESPVRPCRAAFGSDIWFVLHPAKLFACQCVSFWSHFRLLRIWVHQSASVEAEGKEEENEGAAAGVYMVKAFRQMWTLYNFHAHNFVFFFFSYFFLIRN